MSRVHLRGYEDGSDFSPFSRTIMALTWILILVGSFLGLGLFPQPQVGVSPRSFPKGFAFGLGLVPQSVTASSPSSLGSLVLGLRVIGPLSLGITQLGLPSSAKLLSGGATTK